MRILRFIAAATGLLTLFLPETGWMAVQPVPTSVGSLPCIIGSLYCPGGGALGAASYIETTLFGGARLVFLGAAIVLFAYYGVRLMVESSDESTISEVKSAYTYGIAGAAIVTLASYIVQAVGQPFGNYASNNSVNLVNPVVVATTLGLVGLFIRSMVGTALTAVVVYQGMRLIVLQGQDSEIEQQKKRFLHTLIGVAIITLASVIVTDFVAPSGAVGIATGGTGDAGNVALQLIGIANFLMVIIGGLAVLSFIVAGIFLILSTDDGLKDRAKKTIFGTVICLIVLLSTYTIMNFIMGLNTAGLSRV